LIRGSRSVYAFVQVVKYRRDVFDNEEIIGFSEEKDKRDKRDLRSRGSITSNKDHLSHDFQRKTDSKHSKNT